MRSVSIIIPVYNVSAFVGKCATSLMEQTFKDIEFIFVNDASPDNSVEQISDIVSHYPDRDVKIITHDQNKGLPAARNTGLEACAGEYVFHCDGDDWIEPDMIEKMYISAITNDSDLVYCDYYLSFAQNERYMSNPECTDASEMLRRWILGGTMKFNVWNKLVKRSIYTDNDIHFPEGHGMGEDMTMIEVIACCKSVSYVKEALYHYVKINGNAFSNTTSQKHLDDIRYNVDRTESFLRDKYGQALNREIAIFKLSIKLPFLISDKKESYDLWKSWYPEANIYANANKDIPMRTRLLQVMAAHNVWSFVYLYYKIVYRLIYGVIFK